MTLGRESQKNVVRSWSIPWRGLCRQVTCWLASLAVLATSVVAQTSDVVAIARDGGVFEFTVGGELFTRLHTRGYAKPVFYPVLAKGQIAVTRSWPIEDHGSRETDHPHHKSLWYGHGDVNGVDFWTEKGTISVQDATIGPDPGTVELRSEWREGETAICGEVTRISCGAEGIARWIDFDIRLQAAFGPVRFGDTKEGFMAIRTHPDLRLTPDSHRGVHEVFGTAVNSEGEMGKGIWGRPARWVCYFGPVAGTRVGILILDHPRNLRHPTTWHARDYGLIAANPFGLHEFLGRERHAGAVTIERGDELRLRYRFVFLQLNETPIQADKYFEEFAAAK